MSSPLRRFAPRHGSLAIALLLVVGFGLRLYFLQRRAFLAGDSLLYQDIALNWLHAHVYGLSTDAAPRPTLIRLPGYPAVIAAVAWLGTSIIKDADPGTLRSFTPLLWVQILADLGTCWTLASTARQLFGQRARITALALATLCPFMANYTAVPLTETLTLFFIAMTFWALMRWLAERRTQWIIVLAGSLAGSVLLRPDQGLLDVAVLTCLWFSQSRPRRLSAPMVCVLLIALPFLPWTIRNYRTFHVFQPLAPRLANDPGEVPPLGFQRWYRTWAIDFASTQDAYWKYPEEPVRISDLPSRAFDGTEEYRRVDSLFRDTAVSPRLNPAVERAFSELAAKRIRAHPFHYYFLLPTARLLNMVLHPRTEMLPVDERWWRFRAHPAQSAFASVYGMLNLAYLVAACLGITWALRTNRAFTLTMIAYVVLRCLLLLTIDNAEQRYTMEFFPVEIILASSLAVSRRRIS